jgi:hypothetical protein
VPGTSKLLKWYAVSDAVYYHLDVSTDSLFSTFHKSIDIAAIVYNVSGLSPGTTYYWRVRANNGGHWSANSQTWHFNMNSGVGIETSSELNDINVSPNPSTGPFLFTGIEKGYTIIVYDITGKVIFNMASKGESHSVDLGDKAKGIYFYKVVYQGREAKHGKLIIQ